MPNVSQTLQKIPGHDKWTRKGAFSHKICFLVGERDDKSVKHTKQLQIAKKQTAK